MNNSILPFLSDLDDFCQSFATSFHRKHLESASRHRSTANFFVNMTAALIANTYKEKLPSLNIRVKDLERLPALV